MHLRISVKNPRHSARHRCHGRPARPPSPGAGARWAGAPLPRPGLPSHGWGSPLTRAFVPLTEMIIATTIKHCFVVLPFKCALFCIYSSAT